VELPWWLEGRRPRPDDEIRLLDGGLEAFPRMLAAVGAARAEVALEVYQFAPDVIGGRFVEALGAAAARGVRVRVVIDGWGSAPHTAEVADRLTARGCQVEVFNRLILVLVGRVRRTHRKILAVDGEVAFVGGLNVADEYGVPGLPREQAWADLALEIRGPTAAWLQARAGRERGRSPGGRLRIWLSGLGGGGRLRRRYLKALGAARERALLAHAYFLPDRHLVRSITAAARRGVRVRVVLPATSDVAISRPATRRLYRRLLKAGVELREWPRSVLHAKAAVVDGALLLLGSFNLDPFSMANREALAEVNDPLVGGAAERWIEARLEEAVPVRSVGLAGWWEERFGRLIARLAQRIGRWLSRG
jgi:cardiolipin synthase